MSLVELPHAGAGTVRCPTGGVGRPLASKGGRPLHCSVGVLLHNDTVSASDAAIVGGAQVAKAAVRGACAEPVSGLPPHRMGTAVQSWSGEAAAAVPVQGSVVRGPRIRRLLGKPSGAASGAAPAFPVVPHGSAVPPSGRPEVGNMPPVRRQQRQRRFERHSALPSWGQHDGLACCLVRERHRSHWRRHCKPPRGARQPCIHTAGAASQPPQPAQSVQPCEGSPGPPDGQGRMRTLGGRRFGFLTIGEGKEWSPSPLDMCQWSWRLTVAPGGSSKPCSGSTASRAARSHGVGRWGRQAMRLPATRPRHHRSIESPRVFDGCEGISWSCHRPQSCRRRGWHCLPDDDHLASFTERFGRLEPRNPVLPPLLYVAHDSCLLGNVAFGRQMPCHRLVPGDDHFRHRQRRPPQAQSPY